MLMKSKSFHKYHVPESGAMLKIQTVATCYVNSYFRFHWPVFFSLRLQNFITILNKIILCFPLREGTQHQR